MSELPTPNSVDFVAPQQGQAIDLAKVAPKSAEQHMQKLNGEYDGRIFDAGWGVKPRGEAKPSEDVAYLYEDKAGQTFFAVFDGMGGHKAGDMAANTARDVLHSAAVREQHLQNPAAFLGDYFEDAVDRITEKIKTSEADAHGAGTTGLVGIIVENEDGSKTLHGAAVGDSLGFIVRNDGRIEPLNKEESLRQELLDRGHPVEVADRDGNIITNAISRGCLEGVKFHELKILSDR